MEITSSSTCGFHFVGDSSLGKSTLLKVAASVYGSPSAYPRTWRATDNALEATAAAHSDCLLVLDEIGQIEPRVVGEAVYMLGNGEGKARATDRGGSREVQHRWRLVFLSSGEKTLHDHMAEASKRTQAGMDMRLLTIPATPHSDTQKRLHLGIYDDVGNIGGGAALSAQIMEAANSYYGTPIMAFLQKLTGDADRSGLLSWIAAQRKGFAGSHLSKDASGQALRAADHFAIVGVAGELATKAGITGWAKGWAMQAAETCFQAWLNFRGGEGNQEDSQIMEHVRLMLQKFGESRFTRWEADEPRVDEHIPRTMERWGFRRTVEDNDPLDGNTTETHFYLYPEAFKHEFCKGYDYLRVARLLSDVGALDTDSNENRYTKKKRLPGGGQNPTRCFVIKSSALFSDGEAASKDSGGGPPGPETDEWALAEGF